MANSVDPVQMSHSAASDLGLHCFLRLSDLKFGIHTVFSFLYKMEKNDTNINTCMLMNVFKPVKSKASLIRNFGVSIKRFTCKSILLHCTQKFTVQFFKELLV